MDNKGWNLNKDSETIMEQEPQMNGQSYNQQMNGQPYDSQSYGQPYDSQSYGQPYDSQSYGQPYDPQSYGQPYDPRMYGQPGYGGYPMPPQQGNGTAVGSMVCGIISILACWLLGIPSIVLGVIAIILAIASKNQKGYMSGMAVAGLVLGIMGILIGIGYAWYFFGFFWPNRGRFGY